MTHSILAMGETSLFKVSVEALRQILPFGQSEPGGGFFVYKHRSGATAR
ncbi:MAG TPA: hypothetical protein VMU77_06450 [Acidimicrobiales bacterium]|nr:hypothetical protein [Acidimicrobiales bacterium]